MTLTPSELAAARARLRLWWTEYEPAVKSRTALDGIAVLDHTERLLGEVEWLTAVLRQNEKAFERVETAVAEHIATFVADQYVGRDDDTHGLCADIERDIRAGKWRGEP